MSTSSPILLIAPTEILLRNAGSWASLRELMESYFSNALLRRIRTQSLSHTTPLAQRNYLIVCTFSRSTAPSQLTRRGYQRVKSRSRKLTHTSTLVLPDPANSEEVIQSQISIVLNTPSGQIPKDLQEVYFKLCRLLEELSSRAQPTALETPIITDV